MPHVRILLTVASLVVFVLAAVLIQQRIRRKRSEAALRALFESGAQVIGKDFDAIRDLAGPACFFGSMDHGLEAAQWKAGHWMATARFKFGICTEVELWSTKK